jgi:SAM-dependent methyltransferase
MRQPRWKRWLSYLIELHVESAPSAVNPHLYVSLSRGRYQLATANAIYSYGDLYNNFRESFHRLDLNRLPGKDVLLLGFGLGSVPYMLEEVFERHFRYTAVELDEAVIDLANRYVVPELASTIEFVCADAFAFMMQNERQFDLVVMDVFLDDKIPDPFQRPEYLETLQRALKPEGLLMYNRLSLTMADVKQSRLFFENAFKDQFPAGTYLDVEGNWMLLNHSDYLKGAS